MEYLTKLRLYLDFYLISSLLYRLLLKLDGSDVYSTPWFIFVKNALNNIDSCGICKTKRQDLQEPTRPLSLVETGC